MGSFARLTSLFETGRVLELERNGETVTVWVNKLSPFELEEARQDGRVARARAILAMKEVGTPEYDLFQAMATNVGTEAIIQSLLETKNVEFVSKAVRDLRADPAWADRLLIIEQTDPELLSKDPEDPQVQAVDKATRDYTEEVQRLVAEYREDERVALLPMTREKLLEQYRESYVDAQGMVAFNVEYQRSEVLHALRECAAKRVDGRWDHTGCDHTQRICEDRLQVAQLPDEVWTAVRQALVSLNMTVDQARFSAAPGSSSASSEQPSAAEEASTASTQEVTSPEPVGISS